MFKKPGLPLRGWPPMGNASEVVRAGRGAGAKGRDASYVLVGVGRAVVGLLKVWVVAG
jgi:hypothetical protein